MIRTSENQSGFMALTATIIIFAILIILLSIVSKSAFYNRFNVLDYENKKVSLSLAEACANNAIVNIAKDTSYMVPPAGTKITVEAGKTCRTCYVNFASPSYTIETRAVYNKAYSNLAIVGTLGSTNFAVTSWDEPASTPPHSGSCNLP